MDNKVIAIDVGSGTQDVLLYQPGTALENCPKFIVPSRTQVVAAQIRKASSAGREIFLHGHLMGGGACSQALKEHLALGLKAYATPKAALTFNDNLEKVKTMGIELCSEAPAPAAASMWMGDIDTSALEQAIGAFGLEYPQKWAVAVQDHGYSKTESNRTLRFRLWKDFVLQGGDLKTLVFQEEIPEVFTRMRAVQEILPGAVITDTGTAALMGIMADPVVKPHLEQGILAVNVGNSHTLVAAIRGERVYGIFEHHTSLLTLETLAAFVKRFQTAELTNEEVFQHGGHGAAWHPEMKSGWDFVAVTGPRRSMVKSLQWYEAAPYGDMMLTGCFGLLAGLKIL
ncbi:hypothetical protein Desaci_0633 [Desulfosporosinus acidiphilus SJ4]|uniref:Pyruvate formate lyase-activating protein n=1 Tax=Desulfosporosinus acidiphilus (strain DSM 22704 / JCM 16185 / SJ4) TaxID=646529 RepID=I4D1M1_DESAJ|nr:DUF1786 domain-containing protein [Desulfosporosinus acidiphilus]AFM39695.1 hypothetical protein Desaci_0633 [Desulfosporosinus acidiphilus SJ4]